MNTAKPTSQTTFLDDLGDAVRANPISAVLIGAGALWLLGGKNLVSGPVSVARMAGEAASGMGDYAASGMRAGSGTVSAGISKVEETIGEASDAIGRTGSTLAEAAGDHASSVREWSGNAIDDAQDGLSRLMREQPLILGAVGLAIGAAIAAAAPITDTERDNLGNAAASARSMAMEAKDRVIEHGGKVVDAVADEMSVQGLNVATAKTASEDLMQKAKNTISEVKANITRK